MDGSKKFKDMLMETIKITRGRISENDVLRDFISFCALEISTLTDPVHLERAEELRTLLERYSLEARIENPRVQASQVQPSTQEASNSAT